MKLMVFIAAVSMMTFTAAASEISSRVRETVLPRVNLRDAGADSAFEEIARQAESVTEDGVNLVYTGPTGANAPRVTMSLRRVSLLDAIRYITEATGLRYRIDDNAVFITDQVDVSGRIETRLYPINPGVLDAVGYERRQREQRRRRDERWPF